MIVTETDFLPMNKSRNYLLHQIYLTYEEDKIEQQAASK